MIRLATWGASAEHGELVGAIEDRLHVPTAYSPSLPG